MVPKFSVGFAVGVLFFTAALFALGSTVQATDYTNTNFIVRDPVITIEGGRSSTANFQYISSSGQTDTGENTNTNFIHRAGFLYFADPSPAPSPSPSPAGGGLGTASSPGQITRVIFEGSAGAGSTVVLLKDAQAATKTLVNASGNFLIQIFGLSPGNYIFGLYEETQEGRRSMLRIFPIHIVSGATVSRKGIVFEFRVTEEPCPSRGDLNNDCRVDLVDFSILIYWVDRPNPPAHIDLDGSGVVDLVDFSILAYYWTG